MYDCEMSSGEEDSIHSKSRLFCSLCNFDIFDSEYDEIESGDEENETNTTQTKTNRLVYLVHYDVENLRNALSNGTKRSQRALDRALICAARHDYGEKMEILLEHGASPTAEDKKGMTPLKVIVSQAYYRDSNLIKLLAKYCKDEEQMIKNNDYELLRDAVGWPEALTALIEIGANVNKCSSDNNCNAFVVAVALGKYESAEILLEAGSEIDQVWEDETSLMCATRNGRRDLIDLLLHYGSNINKCNYEDETALMWAYKYYQFECMEQLLQEGADSNLENLEGKTVLLMAAEDSRYGNDKYIELLLKYGSDIDKGDDEGLTPLIHAYLSDGRERRACLNLLLEKGADVNLFSSKGVTLLTLAVEIDDVKFVEKILQKGAALNFFSHMTNHIIAEAALYGSHQVLKFVLPLVDNEVEAKAKGAPVIPSSFLDALCTDISTTFKNCTPLTAAVLYGYHKCVNLLMEYGADVDLEDGNGWTPLSLAITCYDEDSIDKYKPSRDLLEFGADPNKVGKCLEDGPVPSDFRFVLGHYYPSDLRGASPLEFAVRFGLVYTVYFLWAAGSSIGRCHRWGRYQELEDIPWADIPILSQDKEEIFYFLKNKQNQPRSLEELNRIIIRQSLGKNVKRKIDTLPIPDPLKAYLKIPSCEYS